MDVLGALQKIAPLAAVVETFQFGDQPLHLRRQLMGPGRRREAAWRTNEQGIAQLVAQLVQLVAQRGLAQRHARGGQRSVAFLIEHVEDQQQVQVLLGDIHFLDTRNKSFRIIES